MNMLVTLARIHVVEILGLTLAQVVHCIKK
jgi:hypothetical protein